MIIEHHAVYSCEWDHDNQSLGRVEVLRGLDPLQHAFSPETYSKFKYGSTTACRHYASEVFLALRCLFSADLDRDDAGGIVMTSSAYKIMPAASTALLADVLALANGERHERDLPPLDVIQIRRASVLDTDYALMTEESRAEAMGSTRLHVDDAMILRGRHLVVLDDCVVTGAHARNISRHLLDTGVSRITYLFLVSVRPAAQSGRPSTSAENYLNHAYVDSIERWLESMNDPDAGPVSARSLKYYLTSGEGRESKRDVLARLRRSVVSQMRRGAIADGMSTSFGDQMEAFEARLAMGGSADDDDDGDGGGGIGAGTIGGAIGRRGRCGEDRVAGEVPDADDAGGGSEDDARDESSTRRHRPPPSPPRARPNLQRSKSSTIRRSARDLRSSLRRHESETFRALRRPILLVDGMR